MDWTRREWLRGAGALVAAGCVRVAGAEADPAGCTLSIGTYSLKGIPLEDAVRAVAGIGFDGIEIAVQPGFEGEPSRLPEPRRKALRKLLGDEHLKLTALMEQITPAAEQARHTADLDRLRRVFALAHDLGMQSRPLIQTVLGGGQWEERKGLFRDRLGDWLSVARDAEGVIAIKPHRGGAMSRPSEAIWLIQQLGDSPRLRMVYDYSHYAFRDMLLEETIQTALPYTAHIAVKDAVQEGDRVTFALPGARGTIDYVTILRLFFRGGYRGDVCCEVSSMVSSQKGYDPIAAAKTCYTNMARAFAAAGLNRQGARDAEKR